MSNRTFCVLRPPGARIRLRAPGCALIGALLLTGCNAGGSIVPPNEGFAIKVNLLCTTCDDFLDCRREPGAIAESTAPGARPPLLIYRLKEKSFWAQIATIGDYLFQLFWQKTRDTRPLAIYRDDGANRSIEQVPSRALIDAAAGTITLPDSTLDMRSGDWLDPRGQKIGRCEAMVRRDGYALMRQFLGRPAADALPASPAPAPAPTTGETR